MAFIIPNASNTGTGTKFLSIDQAEPDSVDFEVLGNIGNSGVVSGCDVSVNTSDSVSVASGAVVVNGTRYSVSAETSLTVSAPSNSRYALIVARVSGGVASPAVIYGNDDGVNPYYPLSASSVASPTSSNVNFATDVVLAAVYRTSGSSITAESIVDKRALLKTVVVNQGTTAPSVGTGSVGELYFSSEMATGTNSGLYVRNSGGWIPLQQNFGAQVPIGAVIAWPSTAAIPSGYLEASGQTVARSSYGELATVLGYNYVDFPTSFPLPNLNAGRVLKGTTFAAGNAGSEVAGSADSVTLTTSNLPGHTHGLNAHTHSYSHTHSISHTHPAATTGSGGSHTHSVSVDDSAAAGFYQWITENNGTWSVPPSGTGSGSYNFALYSFDYALSTSVSTASSHTHSIPSSSHTGNTSSQSSTTTGSNSGNTTSVGDGASFSVVQKSAYVVWIIRATSGDDYPVGTSVYDEAREEVLALTYEGTLPSGSAGDVSAIRLPWAATLTGVKASLDGVGVTASGDITVDVKVDGTSVLGANKITIENTESSSKTAATQADIATSALSDDSLISIDILAANGETGPLNVVLYLSRV